MFTPFARTTIAALLLASSAWATAAVNVTYAKQLDTMSDVPRTPDDRELMEQQLRDMFNELAADVPAGRNVSVEILDIDMAGDAYPRTPIRNVRVIKGRGDYPRISLRYRVEQDGKLISSGERHLVNHNYVNTFNRYTTEMFQHEKQLLDDWFRKEIVAAR